MDGWDGWIGLDWILLRTLVQLEHLAVLKITLYINLREKNILTLRRNAEDVELAYFEAD